MTFQARNLPEQIAQYLRDKIISGELAQGERIAEADLAEKLGVSRAPIREAFRILEKKMLVELTPRRGARVTEMTPSFIEWLYDVLTELYALMVRKASENRKEQDLRRLRDALKGIEDAAVSGDAADYHRALFAYGSTCLEATGDPLLGRLLDDFEPSLRRMQFTIFTERIEGLKKHVPFAESVMSCIEAQDGQKAAETMRHYMLKGKDLAMSLSRENSRTGEGKRLAGNPQE